MFTFLKPITAFSAACLISLSAAAQMNHDTMDHGAMDPAAMHDMRATHMFEGTGRIAAIDLATQKIGLDHGPIPALKWPAMKMAFKMTQALDITGLKPGDKVQFTLHKVDTGAYPIAEICKTTSTKVIPGLCVTPTAVQGQTHDAMPGVDHSTTAVEKAQ